MANLTKTWGRPRTEGCAGWKHRLSLDRKPALRGPALGVLERRTSLRGLPARFPRKLIQHMPSRPVQPAEH